MRGAGIGTGKEAREPRRSSLQRLGRGYGVAHPLVKHPVLLWLHKDLGSQGWQLSLSHRGLLRVQGLLAGSCRPLPQPRLTSSYLQLPALRAETERAGEMHGENKVADTDQSEEENMPRYKMFSCSRMNEF